MNIELWQQSGIYWHALFIFQSNNIVFVQFRQSTFCTPITSSDVLLVWFAVTPICCTCCLDKQHTICDVSLHFVLQVTFSPLSMLLIFLQWSWGLFLQCDALITGNKLILSEKNGRSQQSDQRWGNMMAVDQGHFHNQFYYFCHKFQDKCDKIMFKISMNNTG